MLKQALVTLSLSLMLTSTCALAADNSIPDPFAALKQGKTQEVAPKIDPNTPIVIPEPPTFNAQSWVLMDGATGQVLFEHNGHEKIWPASLTKMMTSYVIGMEFKAGRLRPEGPGDNTRQASPEADCPAKREGGFPAG